MLIFEGHDVRRKLNTSLGGLSRDLLTLQVRSLDEVVDAGIYPHNLRDASSTVKAVVGWETEEVIPSIVGSNDAEVEPWPRCIQLLWSVVCPDNVPVTNRRCFKDWRAMVVTLPNMSPSCVPQRLRELLSRDDWNATLIDHDSNCEKRRTEIPVALRKLDSGSLLVEIVSRLIALATNP